jgi:hypothetical protein
LILQTQAKGPGAGPLPHLRAEFASWSRIRIQADCRYAQTPAACNPPPGSRLRIILKQAFHSNWRVPSECETGATGSGNLILECPAERLLHSPLQLEFRDPLSELSARVSLVAWKAWICLAAAAGLLLPGFAAFRARQAAI